MAGGTAVLSFSPGELVFSDVQFGQVYTQTIALSNTLKGNIEATIRPSAERITVEPASFRLKAGETQQCTVRLRVLKFANKARAVEGQRDVLHIKGPFFDQKVYVTFHLAADALEPTGKQAASQPGNLSPRSRLTARPGATAQQAANMEAAAVAAPSKALSPQRRPAVPSRPAAGEPHTRKSTGSWALPTQPGTATDSGLLSSRTQQGVPAWRQLPGSLGGGPAHSGASSPSLAPGSPTQSVSLANSNEDQPRPRAAVAPMSRPSPGSFEFRPSLAPGQTPGTTPGIRPGASGRPPLAARRPPGPPLAARRPPGPPLPQSAPASPDSHTTAHSSRRPAAPFMAPGSQAPSHLRYAAPEQSRSPPQHPRTRPQRDPLSLSADLGRTLDQPGRWPHQAGAGSTSWDGLRTAKSLDLGLPGGSGHGAGGGEGDGEDVMAEELERLGLGDVRRSRQAWEELNAVQAQQRAASTSRADTGVRGLQQQGGTQQEEVDQEEWQRALPHGPSLALQSALQSLRPCSPTSRDTSPSSRHHNPTTSSLGAGIAGPSHSTLQVDRAGTTNLSPPRVPAPLTGGSSPMAEGLRGRQPGSPLQAGAAKSPSRREQIGASTATIRAAFSNIAAMAVPRVLYQTAEGQEAGEAVAQPQLRAHHTRPSAPAAARSTSPTAGRRLPQGLTRDTLPQQTLPAKPTHSREGSPSRLESSTRHALHPGRSSPNKPEATLPKQSGSPSRGSPGRAEVAGRGRGPGGRSELESSLDALRAHADAQRGEVMARLREAESQLAALQLTASAQLQALADRETTIQVLQAQVSTCRRSQSLEARQAPPPAFEVEARELRVRNQQLEQQVKELEAQCNRHRDEAASIKRMNTELQLRAPDAKRLVEAAVDRQQVLQEERNRKALELLLAKDDRIKELELKVEEAEVELRELRATCAPALSRLEATQAQVLEVLRDKDRLRQDMDAERQEHRHQLAGLHAELAALSGAATALALTEQRANAAQDTVAKLSSQLSSQSAELSSCRDEAARLLQDLARADARIQFLEASADEGTSAHADHMQRVTSRYQGQVAELRERSEGLEQVVEQQRNQLGSIYSAGLGSRLPNLGLQPGASAQDLFQLSLDQQLLAAQARVRDLEAALQQERARQGASNDDTEAAPRDSTSTDANAEVEAALTAAEFELSRMRDLLMSRDRELVTLRAELSLVSVARAEPDERARELSLQLAESQLALQLAQEKAVALDARASIASVQNPDSEALRRELTSARAEVRRSRIDLELAHATSARLNARITETVAAEARAREALQAAQGALATAQDLHAREVAAIEKRLLARAVADQAVVQGKAGASRGRAPATEAPRPQAAPAAPVAAADPAASPVKPGQGAASVREKQLKEALEAALSRATAQEALVAEAQDLAARKAVQVHGTMSSELAALGRKASQSELEVGRMRAELERRGEVLAATTQQLRTAQAALAAAQAAAARAQAGAAAENERLRQEVEARQSELDQALHQGDQRHAQVAVLMDTIEALQAGAPGEQEQQLLALTAQLAAARSNEALLERRCDELVRECGALQRVAGQARADTQAAQAAQLLTEQQRAAAAGLVQALEQQLEGARQEAQAQADASVRTARELDGCLSRCSSLEAEAEGMRVTLRDIQARHIEMITREREEAAANIRFARNEAALAGSRRTQQGTKAFAARVSEPLQELLAYVKRKVADSEEGGKQGISHVMQELQVILPELEQLYQQASIDVLVHKGTAQAAQAQAAAQAAALEARTAEWQVAQVTCQRLQRLTTRRAEKVSSHTARMVQDLRQRTLVLSQQLDASMSAEVAATAQLAVLQGALQQERAAGAAAAAQVALARADVRHLSARLAAANLEHMAAQQQQQGSGSELSPYLEQLMSRLDSRQEGKGKLMALIRELAAVKQSEALAQAQLAAAHKQCDAASLSGQALKEAVQLAATQLAALQQAAGQDAAWGSTPATEGIPATFAVAAEPSSSQAAEVARLRVQVVVGAKEAARLKDRLLDAQQALESREVDLAELHAGAAAHQLLLQQHQDESALALMRQRQQLDEAHEADRQLLIREITDMQARMATLRDIAAQEARDAEARVTATRNAVGDELDAALGRALQGHVPEEEFMQASARADQEEREAERLQRTVDALQSQLTRDQAELMELRDVKEVTAAAVAQLESTLTAIEAAAHAGVGAAGTSGGLQDRTNLRGGGRGRGATAGADKGGGGPAAAPALDALSRELVRAKLAEAEAVRKLRASARAEVELRQKLMQRDDRVADLKERLADAGAGVPDAPGRTGTAGAARARSHSPRRGRARVGADDGGARGRPGARSAARARAAPQVEVRAGRRGQEPGGLAAAQAECDHLSDRLTQARLQAACKDAEIQRLQVELATSITRQHQPLSAPAPRAASPPSNAWPATTPAAGGRLYAELSTANAALATGLASVRTILRQLGGPHLPPSRLLRAGGDDTANLPHALATALQQLAAAVREHTGRPQLSQAEPSTLLLPSLAAVASSPRAAAGALDSPPQALDTRIAALRLQQAEARCAELQRRVEQLTLAATQPQDTGGADISASAAQRQQPAERSISRLNVLTFKQQPTSAPADAPLQHAQAHVSSGGNGGSVGQAQRLLSLLRQSSSALQGACNDLEAVCTQPHPPPQELQQAAATVVSELLGLEAATNLLEAELNHLTQPPHTSSSALHPPIITQDNSAANPAPGQGARQGTTVRPPGFSFPAAVAPSPAPSSASWMTVQEGQEGHSAGPTPHPSGHHQERRRSAGADTPSSTSSSEPSLAGVLHNRSRSLTSAMQAMAVLDPVPATSNLLAERLLQQRSRADKWKARARELGQQLALLGAGSAARDAAVGERVVAAERAVEEQALRHKAEVNRLQAALAGSQAARQEFERASSAIKATATTTTAQPPTDSATLDAVVGTTSSAALLAELRARCSELERQVDTQQAAHQAAQAAVGEEASRLRGLLAQEQGERVRLLGGMREALTGLRTTGDAEGRLRAELLQAHQDAAAAKSAHERAEAQAMSRLSEVQLLRERLKASEKARSDMVQRLQTQLNTVTIRCDRMSEMAAARADELTMKLTAAAAHMLAPSEATQVQLRHVEDDLRALTTALAAACTDHQQDMAGERLTREAHTAEHQRVVEALEGELDACRRAAARQVAELEVLLRDAQGRAGAGADALRGAQERAAEVARVADGERQRLTEQHLEHITELQSRVEHERRAAQEEAALRCESVAAARERAAAGAGAAALAAQEAQYSGQLAASEAACEQLRQQITQLQATFRAFQQQKAAEVAGLEERIVAGIGGGAGGGLMGPGAGAAAAGSALAGRLSKVPANRRGPAGPARPRVAVKARANGPRRQQAGKSGLPSEFPEAWPQPPDTAMGAAAEEVAEVAAADAAGAARRDALFERLQRQQVEAQLGASRRAAQALRLRLRLSQRQLEALRASSVAGEEHARALGEAERLRDALRTCRAESSRRQRALQLLQGLISNTAARGRIQTDEDEVASQLVAAAAAVAAAEQAAAGVADGTPAQVGSTDTRGGGRQREGGGAADPYAQVASTAAAAATHASSVLAQEREVRALLEARLREAQATGARRQQLAKELRQRVDQLEEQLAASVAAAAAAASAAGPLEAKLRQASAAVVRKDVLLRELKTQLDALTAKDSAGGGDEGSKDQAARDARTITRLRSEVARREVALQAALAEIQAEKARCQAAEASASAASLSAQSALRQRHSAALQSHDLMGAVRDLLRLLLRCSAAATAAAAAPAGAPVRAPRSAPAAAPQVASSLAGMGILPGMSMHDIASLTSLSVGEVQDLLGSDPQQQQQAGQLAAGRNSAAVAAARSRCQALVELLEATLLPTAAAAEGEVQAGAGAAGAAGQGAGAQWDPRDLRLLVSCAEQEVEATERALGVTRPS